MKYRFNCKYQGTQCG